MNIETIMRDIIDNNKVGDMRLDGLCYRTDRYIGKIEGAVKLYDGRCCVKETVVWTDDITDINYYRDTSLRSIIMDEPEDMINNQFELILL
jgi:hypothetical protein